ncbi:MAG TPA: NAD-dependent epimerase/dehydratase family protein, partial [Ignavibacteriaceae bacterium]|nr:NAD-dependent epimerase/dehydratase family protein [Ignavibacteriaceae bacterium]
HLIVGFTGGIGRATAKALSDRGEEVIAIARDSSKAAKYAEGLNITVEIGNAADVNFLLNVTKGADVLYYCINIPYPQWHSEAKKLLSVAIEVALKNNLKLVFPGNVYVYGKPQFNPVTEAHPHFPNSVKGRIRDEMEKMLYHHSIQDGLNYVILRFPDFYGPYVINGMYEKLFINALKGKKLSWYGNKNTLTEFIFIEDAGNAMATVGLSDYHGSKIFNYPAHSPISAKDFLQRVVKLSEKRGVVSFSNSLMLVKFAGIFNKMAHEFSEMMYLKQEKLLLSGELFRTTFGKLNSTDYDTGILSTLKWAKNFYKL